MHYLSMPILPMEIPQFSLDVPFMLLQSSQDMSEWHVFNAAIEGWGSNWVNKVPIGAPNSTGLSSFSLVKWFQHVFNGIKWQFAGTIFRHTHLVAGQGLLIRFNPMSIPYFP